MAINLSALASLNPQALTLTNLILVSAQDIGIQPQSAPVTPGSSATQEDQPNSFFFHYEGEQSILLESDITDHFVEDNSSINDQIALKPELFTTHGFIGELNDVVPSVLVPLRVIADKLTVLSGYTPELTLTALRAYNKAATAYTTTTQLANAAIDAWDSLISGTSKAQNKQQVAFLKFDGFWRQKTLFTVQTPWKVFENMAIKTLRAVQDAETRVITDFEITFKQMRFSETITTGGRQFMQGRANNQSQGLVNLGTQTPVPSLGVSTKFSSSFPSLAGG